MSEELPEHVSVNRCYWDGTADQWVAAGKPHLAGEQAWGTWSIPNQDAELLPDKMSGLRAIELGCGTGYVSAWMVRRHHLGRSLPVDPRSGAPALRW